MKILFTLIKFRNLYRVFKSFLSEISTAATVQVLEKIIYLVNVKHMVTKTAVGGTERTSGYFGDQTPNESKEPRFPSRIR
jgi:hypothetical protein